MRNNLALVYKGLGLYETALELLKLALDSDFQHFGEDHPKVAINRNNLAQVYDNLGRYEEAIGLYQLALKSDLKTLGKTILRWLLGEITWLGSIKIWVGMRKQ